MKKNTSKILARIIIAVAVFFGVKFALANGVGFNSNAIPALLALILPSKIIKSKEEFPNPKIEKFLKIVKSLIFLWIGIEMMLKATEGIDAEQFWKDAGSMNYWFFFLSAIFAMTSHYSRALRWKLLINSIGYQPKTKNVFASVLFMYVSNLVIPRSGEVARCGTLYKYEKIPIANLLGTVVIERLVDLFSLLALTGLLVILQFDVVAKLYFESSLPEKIGELNQLKTVVGIALIIGLIVLFVVYKYRRKIFAFGPLVKIGEILKNLKDSFMKLIQLEKKLAFLFHTVIIWLGYIFMFYICFFAFEPTSHLSFAAGITAFVAGSFGMVAPVQGGLGVWQTMVIMALSSLGIDEGSAASWANVAFWLMTGTVAIAGVISFVLLPIMNKNQKD